MGLACRARDCAYSAAQQGPLAYQAILDGSEFRCSPLFAIFDSSNYHLDLHAAQLSLKSLDNTTGRTSHLPNYNRRIKTHVLREFVHFSVAAFSQSLDRRDRLFLMPIATSPALPRLATLTKMEDRKRLAVSAVDDVAPPSKRQHVNGGSKSRDDAADTKEEAWIEEYQKGAIYRQMLEYKREKANVETRLQDLENRSTDHDDHIRTVDAWLLQFIQELEILADGSVSTTSLSSDSAISSGLAFKDSKDFQRHLGDKAHMLKAKVEVLFARLSSKGGAKPEAIQLEDQLKNMLAVHKDFIVKIERLEGEKAALSEQYDAASLKVIKAERKLDRVRSLQVQKLEQKALANATSRSAGDENGESASERHGDFDALKVQFQETLAVAEKQKHQLNELLAELKTLQGENATFKAKKDSITDEDYARTDVFKQFKSQNEDLIRRINNLEAINKQLREDVKKFQEERSLFKNQLEIEAQAVTLDLEAEIQQRDQDLTRIRAARDEYAAELAMRKASQEQEKSAPFLIQELLQPQLDRIAGLETEVERLRPKEDVDMTNPRLDLEALSAEELMQRCIKLERDFGLINKEMPLLEQSFKKANFMANKKLNEFAALEERVAVLIAEKSKADQKYFAARRDNDLSKAENKALRIQNGKSSEIVSQLKEVEAVNRSLITSLEKQIADLRNSNSTFIAENRKLETSSLDANRKAESAKSQIAELTNVVKSRDASATVMLEEKLAYERDFKKLETRLALITSDRDSWKAKRLSNSSEEEDMLRKLVLCSVCRNNFKNTFLKGCGHVFCNECVENRLTNRMRKCPTCNKSFDRSEAMAAHL